MEQRRHLSILYAGAGSRGGAVSPLRPGACRAQPGGSLPAGTVLAGRYTVGDIQSVDGEGILYRGVENNGPFRVTIKEYMPLTLAAERGRDCILRPKPGSEVLFKTTRMDFADLYRSIQRITPANGLELCWTCSRRTTPSTP